MADFDDSSDFIEPASSDDASVRTQDFAITSDYDPTLNESLVGSVTTSVYEHIYENGRRYHSYKPGRYPIPNDDKEASRENVRNELFLDLLGGKLHLAPIGDLPQKIMDIGTGFGEWAIEAGDRYPSAKVLGLDLSPIQSVWIPPNVEFVIDDVEDKAWIHGSDFDFFHLRMMAVTLKNPAAVARTAFANLKPGGWIEFQEVYPRIGCHDDTMPDDYVIARFYRLADGVLNRRYGWDLFAAEHLPSQLESIGYVNIQRKVCHVPLGFWPKDQNRMQHAFLIREILTEFMAAMQAKPLNGSDLDADLATPQEIDALCDEVRTALCDKHVHAYIPFHFVWGQKPHEPPH